VGKYIKFEDVRIRLIGKVRFTDDESEENKMHTSLANNLILEAETQVEQDLSPRYAAPFVHETGSKFETLPDISKNSIKTLCKIKSVILILETDFGSGTAIDAEKYIGRLEKRYTKILTEQILPKVKGAEDSRQWANPPLPGLKKNWFNTHADDGFAGGIFVTSQGDGDYPSAQINDASENWWNGTLDDI